MLAPLDPASPDSAHAQLLSQFLRLAASGKLRPGDPLPKTGELGEQLGIHAQTVQRTYSTLAVMGVSVHSKKVGRHVLTDDARARARAAIQDLLAKEMRHAASTAVALGISAKEFTRAAKDAYGEVKRG